LRSGGQSTVIGLLSTDAGILSKAVLWKAVRLCSLQINGGERARPPNQRASHERIVRGAMRQRRSLDRECSAPFKETIHELTLLTLGPQLRGGALNLLGSRAARKVFDLISSLLSNETVAEGERSLEIRNAAGRLVRVEFAADPDICIREELPSGKFRNLVAIEIKGAATTPTSIIGSAKRRRATRRPEQRDTLNAGRFWV